MTINNHCYEKIAQFLLDTIAKITYHGLPPLSVVLQYCLGLLRPAFPKTSIDNICYPCP